MKIAKLIVHFFKKHNGDTSLFSLALKEGIADTFKEMVERVGKENENKQKGNDKQRLR
jgi:hypothetical protein